MAGRDKEEIKEFMLERITAWIQGIDAIGELGESAQLDHIYDDVYSDTMLYKEDANELERRLQEELETRVELERGHNLGRHILWIDVLSIYVDAWDIYCRPGTYRIPLD